jgi:threonyl-tRNA synthetase
MCMNDAHIYITQEQIREEFLKVMDLYRRYY